MKKTVLLLAVIFCGLVTSCTQKDCSCTATLQKKAASSNNSSTYTVYDWGSSCSNVTSNDIPEISNNGGEYHISCTEL